MANRRIFDIIFRTKGLGKAKTEADGVESSFGGLGKAAKTAAIGFISMQSALKGVEFAKLAAQTETVRRSFGNLAKEPDKMLQAMKKATAGTISEMELMQKFNSAALLGLPLDRFDEMLTIARGASQATGESMEFMLNSIVTGLGRGSKLMLDNLGILIDVEKANEKYASTLGIQASKLTDVQKKQAFVNEALNIGTENLKRAGGVTDSNIDSFGKLNASFDDLQVTIGKLFLPVVAESSEKMASFLSGLNEQDLIDFAIAIGIVTTSLGAYTIAQNAANISAATFKKALPVAILLTIVAGTKQVVSEFSNLQKQADGAAKKFEKFKESNDAIENLKEQVKTLDQEGLLKLQESLGLTAESLGLNVALTDTQAEQMQIINEALMERLENQTLVNEQDLVANELTIRKTELETNYTEISKTGYAAFVEEKMKLIEAEKIQQAHIDQFILSYPKLAKEMGLVTKKEQEHKAALNASSDAFGAMGSIASSTSQLLGVLAGADKHRQVQALEMARFAAIANIAQGVTKAIAQGGIFGIATGASVAAAGAVQIATITQQISDIRAAQFGMNEMVSQPTLILAGEAGPERVNITPASRPSSEQGSRGMTINFLGPVTNRDFVRDTIIPEIDRVQKLGLA